MMSRLVLLALIGSTCTTNESSYPFGDPRACIKNNQPIMEFEVLPGFGWDNLVNENRGLVVSFNYSKCKTTEDKKYLIPDGIVTIPVKTSHMNLFSTMSDHWSQYRTDISASINFGASGIIEDLLISASLSAEFETVKSNQIEDQSITTKTEARYVRSITKMLPGIQLDPIFRSRILRVADHIQQDRKLSARYESELLVRDYGSHVLTTLNAGASIIKVGQILKSILQEE